MILYKSSDRSGSERDCYRRQRLAIPSLTDLFFRLPWTALVTVFLTLFRYNNTPMDIFYNFWLFIISYIGFLIGVSVTLSFKAGKIWRYYYSDNYYYIIIIFVKLQLRTIVLISFIIGWLFVAISNITYNNPIGLVLAAANCLDMSFLGMAYATRLNKCTGKHFQQ